MLAMGGNGYKSVHQTVIELATVQPATKWIRPSNKIPILGSLPEPRINLISFFNYRELDRCRSINSDSMATVEMHALKNCNFNKAWLRTFSVDATMLRAGGELKVRFSGPSPARRWCRLRVIRTNYRWTWSQNPGLFLFHFDSTGCCNMLQNAYSLIKPKLRKYSWILVFKSGL